MEYYLNVSAEALLQKVQPFQAVAALKHVEADVAPLALTGGGVVAAEEIEAAAFVVLVVHSGGLRVLRAVAVYQKRDAPAGLFAAGVVKAAQQFAALGAHREAQLRSFTQSLRCAVAVGVVVRGMRAFVHYGVQYPRAVAAEGVFIHLGQRGTRGRSDGDKCFSQFHSRFVPHFLC